MWDAHFAPQTHWLLLPGVSAEASSSSRLRARTVLVRYSADAGVFSRRIQAAMASLGVAAPPPSSSSSFAPVRPKNRSRRSKSSSSGEEGGGGGAAGAALLLLLEEGDQAWLRDSLLHEDLRLWAGAQQQARSGSGPWKHVF